MKNEAPGGSHNPITILGSFTKVPKTGQRSEISRRLSSEALEGRGPVVEAGKREGPRTEHQPQLCPIPGSAGWGGKGAKLTRKPGELGTGKLVPSEVGMGARNLAKALAQRTRGKTREEKVAREGEREID